MDTEILYGAQVISDLWKETNGDAIIVSDVGQHQMLEHSITNMMSQTPY